MASDNRTYTSLMINYTTPEGAIDPSTGVPSGVSTRSTSFTEVDCSAILYIAEAPATANPGDKIVVKVRGYDEGYLNTIKLSINGELASGGSAYTAALDEVTETISFAKSKRAKTKFSIESINKVVAASKIINDSYLNPGGDVWATAGEVITINFNRFKYGCIETYNGDYITGSVVIDYSPTKWIRDFYYTVPDQPGSHVITAYKDDVTHDVTTMIVGKYTPNVGNVNFVLNVVDKDDLAPKADANVEIKNSNGQVIYNGSPDSQGRIELSDATPGTYTMSVKLDGYIDIVDEPFEVIG